MNPLLQWKRSKYYSLLYESVCVCVDARERALARECAYTGVALLIQNKMRMRHIVICSLFGSAIFFDIIS